MTTNIGISKGNRESVVNTLSKILADEFVLYTKTRNAHWNVEGIDFYEKHKFFETQFEQIDDIIDNIAERIRLLGHYAPATLKSFLSLSQLSETTPIHNNSMAYIKELLSDHETIIIYLRKNINQFADDFNDLGTSDFITGLMQEHEKMAWFLRSHI
ncbi:DNA starvation/stationary phase protection protein [Flavobacterium pectinovorum]|uniref:Dps family protein n=1 Tax=Flavobacterium pectinovorum TaxID=29533 RepID=UPI00265E2D67|nr:DNA starvation/stationary phase protection protein [Flavobacterium pectinovorum]WKL49657.1 DNA starvation/stationary phase protection protein [Flavobacterium pectinovorum]